MSHFSDEAYLAEASKTQYISPIPTGQLNANTEHVHVVGSGETEDGTPVAVIVDKYGFGQVAHEHNIVHRLADYD